MYRVTNADWGIREDNEKVAFDLSHEETVGVFYVEESGRDTPSRVPACSEA